MPGTDNEYECVKEGFVFSPELIDRLGVFGWHITDYKNGSFYFSKYSPAGQDFGFEVEGEDIKDLAGSIYKYYEDYDVSHEAYLWLDEWGHGRNGAPYDMKDVYEDMEACQDMVWELHEVIIREELL